MEKLQSIFEMNEEDLNKILIDENEEEDLSINLTEKYILASAIITMDETDKDLEFFVGNRFYDDVMRTISEYVTPNQKLKMLISGIKQNEQKYLVKHRKFVSNLKLGERNNFEKEDIMYMNDNIIIYIDHYKSLVLTFLNANDNSEREKMVIEMNKTIKKLKDRGLPYSYIKELRRRVENPDSPQLKYKND